MENNENNNLSELDQLKAQYETLKQQFDQQEIVNDRLMKSSIRQSTDFYRRYRLRNIIMYPLAAILGIIGMKLCFGNNLSLSLFWFAFMLTCFVIELVLTRKFQRKTLENEDLLVLSNTARSFKKLFSVFTVLNYSTGLILVAGLFLTLVGKDFQLPNMTAFILVFCFVIVAFVSIGVAEIRYKTRPCDEIIRQIEASDDTLINNKRTGFDKKQKLLCAAMLVVFLGFDVWAYTIVGTYLKLPPMWQDVTYTRTDDSLPVEDDLSIWEVFADTLIAAEDVPALTKLWQEDPSIVVAKGYGDDGQTVNLYALKMASPEGPLVSSKRIGGRPVVERIKVREPKVDHGVETIPVLFFMTPEAKQLWSSYFSPDEEIKSIDIAFVVDGVVYRKTTFTSLQGVTNNSFFIHWKWGKDKLDDFCERLVRQ